MTTSKKLIISAAIALVLAIICGFLLVSRIEKAWQNGSFGSISIKIEHTPALDQDDSRKGETK